MGISLGATAISGLKFGATDVARVMLGTTEVFSAEWTPASLSNLNLWLDAQYISGVPAEGDPVYSPPVDGTAISSWTCRAHPNHSLVQPTATYQPVYQSNGIGSLPGIDFPDRNEFLYDANLVIDAPIQVAAVVQINVTGASQRYLFDGYNSSTERFLARYELTNSDAIRMQTTIINEGDGQGTENVYGSGLATGTAAHIMWFSHGGDGQTAIVRKDGAQVATGTLGQERMNGLTLGNSQMFSQDQTLTQLGLRGRIGEFVVSSGTQSSDAMEKTEGYLAHRWNLASVLPSNHPYKNAAP